ncbi:MAG: InlB B-repeat-containing protein [Spirochaetaceae bacterium]
MRKKTKTISLMLTAAAVVVMAVSCNLSNFSGVLFSTHQLTLNDGTGGSVLLGAGEYYVGEKVTVTVEPDTDYVFYGWEGAVDAIKGFSAESSTEHSFSMPAEDIELTAQWVTLGDEGPAGGLIFYLDEADEFDWIGLEAAPEDIEVDGNETFQWGAAPYWWIVGDGAANIGETEETIGSGHANSTAIVDFIGSLKHKTTGESYYVFDWDSASSYERFTDGANTYDLSTNNDGTVAAKECLEYVVTHNGKTYDDWFLPSKEELEEIDLKLHQAGDGGFEDAYYKSSSEYSTSHAWSHNFATTGSDTIRYKYEHCRVRAVRALKPFGN